MKQAKLPKGWSLQKVKRVAAYYDSQSEEEAAREIEDASRVAVKVPPRLLPKLRSLLAKPDVEIQAEELFDLHEQRENRVRILLAKLSGNGASDPASRRRKLQIAIVRKLSREQRLTVILRYFEEFPFSEIASALGISLREVQALHRSAISVLRESM